MTNLTDETIIDAIVEDTPRKFDKRLQGRKGAKPPHFLTAKQSKFATEYIKAYKEGARDPGLRAASVAYDATSLQCTKQMSSNALKNPRVRAVIQKALEDAGVTPDLLADRVKGALDATKSIYSEGIKVAEEPDHRTRLEAVKEGFKVLDAYPRTEGSGGSHLHQHVHFDEPIEITRFIVLNGRMPTEEERKQITKGD
jgi:hypothetical protein